MTETANGGNRTDDQRFTDRDRAAIIASADVLAAASIILVLMGLHFPVTWLPLVWWCLATFVVLFLGCAWLGGIVQHWWQSFRKRRASKQSEVARRAVSPWWVKVAAILNAIVIAALVVGTGGVAQSPFSPYVSAYLVFGLFLASSAGARVSLLVGGIAVYMLLGFYGPVASYALQCAVGTDADHLRSAREHATIWINIANMAIAFMCTVQSDD